MDIQKWIKDKGLRDTLLVGSRTKLIYLEALLKEFEQDLVKLFAMPAVVGRSEQLCQHDRSVTNRICDDCGSIITYVPDDELA